MANPYFTFSTPLTPGTRARANEINQLFQDIETAFDNIPAVGSAPFGTPTVKVGLTFAQGSANFVLRSDAQLALDESIAPTWTGAHTFTSSTTLFSAASPALRLHETDGGSNEKYWDFVSSGGDLFFQTVNDALNASTTFMRANRTGTTVDSIALTSTALTWNGNAIFTTANDGAGSGLDADLLDGVQGSDYARISSANVFTGTTMRLSNANDARFILDDSNATSNERYWELRSTSGQFFLRAQQDNDATGVNAIVVDRTGTTIDSIALASTALTWNGNAIFTTANDGSGSGLDADLLDGQEGSFYRDAGNMNAGNLAYARFSVNLLANDGASSGLDADLLDGVQGSDYARISATNTFTGSQIISNALPELRFNETDAAANNRRWDIHAASEELSFTAVNDAASVETSWLTVSRTGTTVDSIALAATALTWNGNTLFTTANDGASSGLDADLLDGQHGSFYQNASNINAGTLNAARLHTTVDSGTYTPTLTNTTNVSSSTAAQCQYLRIGNVVTVSGQISVTATAAAGTDTNLGISLPIASNIGAQTNCSGAGACLTAPVGIAGDAVNDRATANWASASSVAQSLRFTFTYLIV
jgi:hypothetical protein